MRLETEEVFGWAGLIICLVLSITSLVLWWKMSSAPAIAATKPVVTCVCDCRNSKPINLELKGVRVEK